MIKEEDHDLSNVVFYVYPLYLSSRSTCGVLYHPKIEKYNFHTGRFIIPFIIKQSSLVAHLLRTVIQKLTKIGK